MKYTQGPWLVHEWGTQYQVVESEVRTTRKPGITMSGQKILARQIDKKADARLIAAAPDMYEALTAYQLSNRIHNDTESDLFDKAKLALAKAEGKEVPHELA